MKTVLKDVKTGLLFRNMDEWTSSIQEAAGFRDTLTALKFCQRNNLHGAAVVHIFGGGASQKVAGFYRSALGPASEHRARPAREVNYEGTHAGGSTSETPFPIPADESNNPPR